jgi:hypothetical protein
MAEHYAASRKITGSIPDEVTGFFNLPKPFSQTMEMGFIQSLKYEIRK